MYLENRLNIRNDYLENLSKHYYFFLPLSAEGKEEKYA